MTVLKYRNNSVYVNILIKDVFIYTQRYYRGINPYCNTKEIFFKFEEEFFHYWEHGSYNGSSSRLSQMDETGYLAAIAKYKDQDGWQPSPSGFVRSDEKYNYSITQVAELEFKEYINLGDIVVGNATINSLIQKRVASLEELDRQEEELRKKERREYAQKCGKISREMGISFPNVLALGWEDKGKLLAFHVSLLDAKERLSRMSREEKEEFYHELFHCGRMRKRSAATALGIELFDADPNRIDFSFIIQ